MQNQHKVEDLQPVSTTGNPSSPPVDNPPNTTTPPPGSNLTPKPLYAYSSSTASNPSHNNDDAMRSGRGGVVGLRARRFPSPQMHASSHGRGSVASLLPYSSGNSLRTSPVTSNALADFPQISNTKNMSNKLAPPLSPFFAGASNDQLKNRDLAGGGVALPFEVSNLSPTSSNGPLFGKLTTENFSVLYPKVTHTAESIMRAGEMENMNNASGMIDSDDVNSDLAEIRVQGFFREDLGAIISSDLPRSTLLYVLTASDGRDLMFKLIQYFLQLLICLLKMPWLFSPDMQGFTGPLALRFWRNYNTIRHGRSLFKMGRGILNLFTFQTACERLWMRYGGDVIENCMPWLSFLPFECFRNYDYAKGGAPPGIKQGKEGYADFDTYGDTAQATSRGSPWWRFLACLPFVSFWVRRGGRADKDVPVNAPTNDGYAVFPTKQHTQKSFITSEMFSHLSSAELAGPQGRRDALKPPPPPPPLSFELARQEVNDDGGAESSQPKSDALNSNPLLPVEHPRNSMVTKGSSEALTDLHSSSVLAAAVSGGLTETLLPFRPSSGCSSPIDDAHRLHRHPPYKNSFIDHEEAYEEYDEEESRAVGMTTEPPSLLYTTPQTPVQSSLSRIGPGPEPQKAASRGRTTLLRPLGREESPPKALRASGSNSHSRLEGTGEVGPPASRGLAEPAAPAEGPPGDAEADASARSSAGEEGEGGPPPDAPVSAGSLAASEYLAEPASAALPARWRQPPLHFPAGWMALLALRSLAASARRLLRDLSLLSAEGVVRVAGVEARRGAIQRGVDRLWLLVSGVDLLLNTRRLLRPGWVRYATARQRVRGRCGCPPGRRDARDVRLNLGGVVTRRKADLVFPALNLDYGAPAVSYVAYFEAADPVHLRPVCATCGCVFKEPAGADDDDDDDDARRRANGLERASDVNPLGSPMNRPDPLTSPGKRPLWASLDEAEEAAAEAEAAPPAVNVLLLPSIMRSIFNYIWLVRAHPNFRSTLLLQVRYLAEFFLAYMYCFGGYETGVRDAALEDVLHPAGAIAGMLSAAVGLLRVVESAPQS